MSLQNIFCFKIFAVKLELIICKNKLMWKVWRTLVSTIPNHSRAGGWNFLLSFYVFHGWDL